MNFQIYLVDTVEQWIDVAYDMIYACRRLDVQLAVAWSMFSLGHVTKSIYD